MDSIPDVTALQERKLRLIAACDLQREMIDLELGAINYRLAAIKRTCLRVPKLWLLAAPVAGFLATRRVRPKRSVLAKGLLVWTAARKGWKLWRSLRRG